MVALLHLLLSLGGSPQQKDQSLVRLNDGVLILGGVEVKSASTARTSLSLDVVSVGQIPIERFVLNRIRLSLAALQHALQIND